MTGPRRKTDFEYDRCCIIDYRTAGHMQAVSKIECPMRSNVQIEHDIRWAINGNPSHKMYDARSGDDEAVDTRGSRRTDGRWDLSIFVHPDHVE